MVDIFEELKQIRNEKEKLKGKIDELQSPFKSEIDKLMWRVSEIAELEVTRLNEISERENVIKNDLVSDWPYGEPTYLDDATGIKIQKRKSDKPEILDLKGLLEKVLTFDELPIKKVSFDNRKILTLTEAGAISRELVEIQTTYNIAVTFPKQGL